MKFVNIFILTLLSLWLFVKPIVKPQKYIIVGAGPVGLYLANELLKQKTTEKVTIYETRKVFNRPQCLRLPFAIANKFPGEIKQSLWPSSKIRDTLFKNRTNKDNDFKDFWPSLGYQYFPRINVGNLQSTFIDYLNTKYGAKFQIEFKDQGDKKGVQPNEVVEEYGKSNEVDIIFVTAGNGDLNKQVRKDLNKYNNFTVETTSSDFTQNQENIFDGVYLIYNNTNGNNIIEEDYKRNNIYMNRSKLSEDGITYSATNNKYGMVQFYTYDVGAKFQEIYRKLDDDIKKSAGWVKYINYTTGETTSFSQEKDLAKKKATEDKIKAWAGEFKTHLDSLLKKYSIKVPGDTRIHWAPRLHYAYKETHALNKNKIPVVFAGDAMGGTDYKYGLNLGRGLYEADQFVKLLSSNTNSDSINVNDSLNQYKRYWLDILAKEFGDPKRKLTDDNSIFYKYVVRGRSVNGRLLGEDVKDLQFYLDAIRGRRRKLK